MDKKTLHAVQANIAVNTKFGKISIDPSQIISFPKGIPGFEKSTQWKLFHEIDASGKSSSGVVIHMLSVNDGGISLSLTDPTLFGFDYNLELTDSEVAELKLDDPKDMVVLAILSSQSLSPPLLGCQLSENTFANISAPILINTKSRIGMQKILTAPSASVAFRPQAFS